jgi:hypothetical protein
MFFLLGGVLAGYWLGISIVRDLSLQYQYFLKGKFLQILIKYHRLAQILYRLAFATLIGGLIADN